MQHDEFYVKIAEEISKASKCLRGNWGVVVVKDDAIIGTGYNGPARGITHCSPCRRASDPPGVGYEKCIAAHAEVNAIIQSGGRAKCLGATLYIGSHNRKPVDQTKYNSALGFFPCDNCFKYIVNSGIAKVVQRGAYGTPSTYSILNAIQKFNKHLSEKP